MANKDVRGRPAYELAQSSGGVSPTGATVISLFSDFTQTVTVTGFSPTSWELLPSLVSYRRTVSLQGYETFALRASVWEPGRPNPFYGDSTGATVALRNTNEFRHVRLYYRSKSTDPFVPLAAAVNAAAASAGDVSGSSVGCSVIGDPSDPGSLCVDQTPPAVIATGATEADAVELACYGRCLTVALGQPELYWRGLHLYLFPTA